jgi:uncharacterized protein with PIN domain
MSYKIERYDFIIKNPEDKARLLELIKKSGLTNIHLGYVLLERDTPIGSEYKNCSTCKKSLLKSNKNFAKESRRKDGLSAICKSCKKLTNQGLSVKEIRSKFNIR